MKPDYSLKLINNVWFATLSDLETIALLETDTIPTAYTSKTSAAAVLAFVSSLNPNKTVVLAQEI